MTSSGTPTDRSRREAERLPAGSGGIGSWLAARPWIGIGASLLAAGWLLVLYVHNWRVDAGVIFLWLGWLSVLLIGRYMWKAAFTIATEPEGDEEEDDGFEVAATRREELEREKRSLLKAIKEVEFDRALGKMSEEDAEEIILFYRVRAIEVLRQLERIDRGEIRGDLPASVTELIDREVRARLALFGGGRSGAERAAAAESAAEEAPAKEPEGQPEAKADEPVDEQEDPEEAAPAEAKEAK